ncbi:phenylacetate-CoA ligase [Candidatus Moduliflexus flocculans]|uniref:Phenylacetate-coenzyme A ligase n=1 Tax=Candidatus Moduliflexus flocculans TaxID=1499966 RepID=A0A0S6W0K9_9BACT|nr:phenylacetate-CoA ligase [Candidatus Moduliflexus flocculans]
MYWQQELETMPVEALRALQLSRLQTSVRRAITSPYYQQLYQQRGITADDLNTLDDVKRLPFTTKQDLRNGYPYGFLTVPKTEVVRLHSSSGTTGQATVIFHTAADIRDWANLMARCMYMTGARNSDVFQNMSGYGMFTGGLGFHYGAELLGMLTVPAGSGNSKRQIHYMKDFQTSVIHIIPSYALHMISVFEEEKVNPRDLHLRIAFLGAEPHTEHTRKRVEDAFGVKAFNSYGLSEMYGPGVAFECPEQNGLHIWEDSYFVEVINPDTLEPVADGEIGELVLTTLTREAMPLIRYRTRDLTSISSEPCPCGRTHRRIARIKGRSDDMLIIKGVNVFPMQVEAVLMSIPEVGTNYQIELETVENIDVMTVNVEVRDDFFLGDVKGLTALQQKITNALKSEVLFTPKVKLVEPDSIPEAQGKAVRVIDRRVAH